MKKIYFLCLSFLFCLTTRGQDLQIVSPGDGFGICATDPFNGTCIFPSSSFSSSLGAIPQPYVLQSTIPTIIQGIVIPVPDPNTNFYRANMTVSGFEIFLQFQPIIFRKNNKWTMLSVLAGTNKTYETTTGGNDPTPPCLAVWTQLLNNVPQGTTEIEFDGGCNLTYSNNVFNTELHPMFVNPATASNLIINNLPLTTPGLRKGSMIYNGSNKFMQFYNGNSWSNLYSDLKPVNIKFGNSIFFETASGYPISSFFLTPNTNQIETDNFYARGRSTGYILKSELRIESGGAFFEKVTFFTANYTVSHTDHNLIFRGTTVNTLTIPSFQNVVSTGRVLVIKNFSPNTLNVSPGFQDTAAGALITTIASGAVRKLIYDGTRWVAIQ